MMDRRGTLQLGFAALVAGCAGGTLAGKADPAAGLTALEASSMGKLGVCALDTATGKRFGWRLDERFAHCSSFKLSLAARMLQGAQRGEWRLDERLRWTEADLLANSPVTSLHVASGLTIEELARATLIASDNAAANVLLRRIGGPQAITAFWAGIGDRVSRLDRFEPEMNKVPPGTELDTSTPAAMAATVGKLVTGDVLIPAHRALLIRWMIEVKTGARRLRAGFPESWISGDKTGTAWSPGMATYVDLGFGGPPNRAPLIIAAYFEPARGSTDIDPAAEAVLAEVGRLCAASLESRT